MDELPAIEMPGTNSRVHVAVAVPLEHGMLAMRCKLSTSWSAQRVLGTVNKGRAYKGDVAAGSGDERFWRIDAGLSWNRGSL